MTNSNSGRDLFVDSNKRIVEEERRIDVNTIRVINNNNNNNNNINKNNNNINENMIKKKKLMKQQRNEEIKIKIETPKIS